MRLLLLFAAGLMVLLYMRFMPGRSFHGQLPPLSPEQQAVAAALRSDVEFLAGELGSRYVGAPEKLDAAATHIAASLAQAGYAPQEQVFTADGVPCRIVIAEIRGLKTPDKIIVIGSHYDSAEYTPGADDNASGTAALMALASTFSGKTAERTLRFVAFPNEEPPHFQQGTMGSLRYAAACAKAKEEIVAMISLEMLGYFSQERNSQMYPKPLHLLYPDRGNFIAFIGNFRSSGLVRRSIASFRRHAAFPSEGAIMPAAVPGVAWSDHWSFWRHGYRAIMVTDTALYRNPNYHTPHDTPQTLDYDSMARVVTGLEGVIAELAGSK